MYRRGLMHVRRRRPPESIGLANSSIGIAGAIVGARRTRRGRRGRSGLCAIGSEGRGRTHPYLIFESPRRRTWRKRGVARWRRTGESTVHTGGFLIGKGGGRSIPSICRQTWGRYSKSWIGGTLQIGSRGRGRTIKSVSSILLHTRRREVGTSSTVVLPSVVNFAKGRRGRSTRSWSLIVLSIVLTSILAHIGMLVLISTVPAPSIIVSSVVASASSTRSSPASMMIMTSSLPLHSC
mmetsp:Transcript_24642/g.56490  ORF Transcript_24642/g.56490 Transcript_24642/m.56490 type:complete len:237 (+) Transcript_24642:2617-3327(+)